MVLKLIALGLVILVLAAGAWFVARPHEFEEALYWLGLKQEEIVKLPPGHMTLTERMAHIGPDATEKLKTKFAAARVVYPPADITLIGLKAEKKLQIYARSAADTPWTLVHTFPVLAASGGPGPKLREGDRQVPEGLYDIDLLNPNSKFHVSMRVNYPNAFDKEMAAKDKRANLGGAIMIHGRRSSIGCLAIGDPAMAEVFTLTYAVGMPKVKVIIAPHDFRRRAPPKLAATAPDWVPGLYTEIEAAMKPFPLEGAKPAT